MNELHQTAFAYYKDAPEEIKRFVNEFFYAMDHDRNDRVSLAEFLTYMEMYEDCMHLSNPLVFDELKTEGREELEFTDVITLFYIIYSGKPFCKGHCNGIIKGVYFTCLKCFDDYATDATNTFNVCTACYVEGKYVHGHKEFLDSFLLLTIKRKTVLNQQAASVINESTALEYGSTSKTSWSSSHAPSSSCTSNAMVPVNPRPKNCTGMKVLKTIEVLAALGNMVVATQCTIM